MWRNHPVIYLILFLLSAHAPADCRDFIVKFQTILMGCIHVAHNHIFCNPLPACVGAINIFCYHNTTSLYQPSLTPAQTLHTNCLNCCLIDDKIRHRTLRILLYTRNPRIVVKYFSKQCHLTICICQPRGVICDSLPDD